MKDRHHVLLRSWHHPLALAKLSADLSLNRWRFLGGHLQRKRRTKQQVSPHPLTVTTGDHHVFKSHTSIAENRKLWQPRATMPCSQWWNRHGALFSENQMQDSYFEGIRWNQCLAYSSSLENLRSSRLWSHPFCCAPFVQVLQKKRSCNTSVTPPLRIRPSPPQPLHWEMNSGHVPKAHRGLRSSTRASRSNILGSRGGFAPAKCLF